MKIGISGTHGVGKSYTLYNFANEYKLKYPDKEVTVITEVARKCPLPINKDATLQAQQWMMSTQIQKEIEAENNCDIVVTDRTVVDYAAYTMYQYKEYFYKILPFIKFYISTYDKIYFKLLENNQYLIDDGKRAVDKEFQQEIHNLIEEIYGMAYQGLKDFIKI